MNEELESYFGLYRITIEFALVAGSNRCIRELERLHEVLLVALVRNYYPPENVSRCTIKSNRDHDSKIVTYLGSWRPNSNQVPTISSVTFEGEARSGLGTRTESHPSSPETHNLKSALKLEGKNLRLHWVKFELVRI